MTNEPERTADDDLIGCMAGWSAGCIDTSDAAFDGVLEDIIECVRRGLVRRLVIDSDCGLPTLSYSLSTRGKRAIEDHNKRHEGDK